MLQLLEAKDAKGEKAVYSLVVGTGTAKVRSMMNCQMILVDTVRAYLLSFLLFSARRIKSFIIFATWEVSQHIAQKNTKTINQSYASTNAGLPAVRGK
ncbi:predicted protein [Sclerotinia sclerotiorum 1980 UF-70]|uniref:Uncharacterized protein n=1 Tax=Sclerotinia sclerotiorum (strain ATCC 18683 / 1980 / Ss-1) TaxID=665079 RepID=A7EP08_SCLS1|nr:predicted protein [Sclerotinia sclerotiorum 1980 UF-70]EDO04574.1 predicted protein [Sclerotinia sclerotiorum 1980 UF-70]